MDFITDLVKERGITNIIFNFKNEMEYLENKEYLNEFINNHIKEIETFFNNYFYNEELLDITEYHIQNIALSLNIIDNDNSIFEDIFEIPIDDIFNEGDFNLQTFFNYLTDRKIYLEDKIFTIECIKKVDLENKLEKYIENEGECFFNIQCYQKIIDIEYKEQDYFIEF